MNVSLIKEFKGVWERLWIENSFTRNVAITLSGNAIGQVIGFFLTPFIARAYGPASYGLFALFSAVASNFALISTFQLPTGYVAAKDKRELHILVRLTFFILVFFTTFLIIALLFFTKPIVDFFEAENLSVLIYFIPVYIFFMGIDYMLLGWNIYLKQFSRGAFAKVASILISKSVTLLYGVYSPTATGIIMGNFLIYPLESIVKLSKKLTSDIPSILNGIAWKEMAHVLRKYKSYPLLVTPGLLVTSLNGQLPIFCFSFYFQQSNVGLFALASSIITVPLSVITGSTTTVFLQKAAETYNSDPGMLKRLVLSLHRRLFIISFIPLVLFSFISEWAFILVFGNQWAQAGVFAAFLSISAILGVSQQPLSVLFRLMHREQYNFIVSATSIVLKIGGLALGVFNNNIQLAVAGFALASIQTTALSLAMIFRMVKIELWELNGYFFAVLIVFFTVTFKYLEQLI